MSKELVISANRHETRVAVLEDDQVVEVFYQRENEYSLAGSIHKGRVTRVLPGMTAPGLPSARKRWWTAAETRSMPMGTSGSWL